MRRAGFTLVLALAAGLLVLGGCQPRSVADPEALAGTVAVPEPDSPFVALDIWVRAGSQDDPAGREGLAALTASLLANGSTEQDDYPQILEQLYPMATSYASAVDKEMTVFRGVVHRDNLEVFYALLRNALLHPAWKQEDFERVHQQQRNFVERARRFERDEELSKELLFARAFQGTTYQHPEEGMVQSVAALTLADVREFYAIHYRSGNIVVGVGGGYPEGFVARVRADFDLLPAGVVELRAAPEPQRPQGLKVLIVEKETDATAISIGFPIDVVRGDEDFYPLVLVNSWFGEHRNAFSHLYQVIRERRGMNYGDYSYVEAFPLGYATHEPPVHVARRRQLFEIWIRPISNTEQDSQHTRALFATRAALRELRELVQQGLPADQVERARQYLTNFSVTYGSTTLRRLGYAIDDSFYELNEPYLQSFRARIEGVTHQQVDAAIRRHLQADDLWIVFITRDAEGMRDLLLSGDPTPIHYAGEPDAELLAEDAEIAGYALPVRAEDIEILDIQQVFEQ